MTSHFLLSALLVTGPAMSRDTVCGPRCVQSILQSYGKPVELLDLVRELHADGVEKGTTLGQLRDVIQARGLYAEVVRLPEGATLTWNEPAILHLRPMFQQSLGHFIVHLNDEHGNPVLFDPLVGKLNGTPEVLRASLSGDLMLVSQHPISPTTAFAKSESTHRKSSVIVLCAIGIAVILWRCRKSSTGVSRHV